METFPKLFKLLYFFVFYSSNQHDFYLLVNVNLKQRINPKLSPVSWNALFNFGSGDYL